MNPSKVPRKSETIWVDFLDTALIVALLLLAVVLSRHPPPSAGW